MKTILIIIYLIVNIRIITPFSFDDFIQFTNSEIRWGDELCKHNFLYNGVTQLIRKLCFVIFDLREVGIIQCVCTSFEPNVVRPKSELNKSYKYEGL